MKTAFTIIIIFFSNGVFSQDITKDKVLTNRIKRVTIFSLPDSVTYSYEYLKNGLLKNKSRYPDLIYGKNSTSFIDYNYIGTSLISEIHFTKTNDTIVTSTKTLYEYDSLNRISLTFYSQDGFTDNEVLTKYTYSPQGGLNYCYEFIYWTDSTSSGVSRPNSPYKNGKTYYLRDYKLSFGENLESPINILFYTKCDGNGNGIINGFCQSSTQTEIKFGDTLTQIITTSQDGTVLKSQIKIFDNGNIVRFLSRDFDRDYGNESSVDYIYDLKGLIKKSIQLIKWKAPFNMPTSNNSYLYKYEFY
ncbi:MAG: hypothetical protein QM791_00310 [Ferruginibacter sp.]